MGSSNKRHKVPKIVDAEVLEDGMICIEMNLALPLGNSKKILLPAETLYALAEEHASIPPAADTDFPGVPVLAYEDVFSDDEEPDTGEDDGDAKEKE